MDRELLTGTQLPDWPAYTPGSLERSIPRSPVLAASIAATPAQSSDLE
jgi:hypothetical protein